MYYLDLSPAFPSLWKCVDSSGNNSVIPTIHKPYNLQKPFLNIIFIFCEDQRVSKNALLRRARLTCERLRPISLRQAVVRPKSFHEQYRHGALTPIPGDPND